MHNFLSINHSLLHHPLSELEANVTKHKDRLPEIRQDPLWVCIISLLPEGQLKASGENKREGGLGVSVMQVCIWMLLQTNEAADCMSGPAGFLKNKRKKKDTLFSVRSLQSRCVTICRG